MLKINPIDMVALDVLLKHVLATNPENAMIQKHLGQIHKNVAKKKKDYQGVFAELNQEFESILAEQICGGYTLCNRETPISLSVDKVTCSSCHFNKNICQKADEIKRYWGYNEGEFSDYYKKYNIDTADECILFMHSMKLTIVDKAKDGKNLFNVKIDSNGDINQYVYSLSNLQLFVHKYGEDSIVNYDEYKDVL